MLTVSSLWCFRECNSAWLWPQQNHLLLNCLYPCTQHFQKNFYFSVLEMPISGTFICTYTYMNKGRKYIVCKPSFHHSSQTAHFYHTINIISLFECNTHTYIHHCTCCTVYSHLHAISLCDYMLYRHTLHPVSPTWVQEWKDALVLATEHGDGEWTGRRPAWCPC